MELTKQKRQYHLMFTIFAPIIRMFYWFSATGKENVPEGAAVICANHSSWIDPFLIAVGIGKKYQLHMMAKVEIFKLGIVRWFLAYIGTFPVDRSKTDMQAIRTTLKYLNAGEKVGIFPEGTRKQEDNEVDPKVGAIKMAEKTRSPIVPVYIPRKKGIFRPFKIVVGEPYYINPDRKRLSADDYANEAKKLMEKISGLNV